MRRSIGHLLSRVLMIAPKHFQIKYKINPWMKGTVDKFKAEMQWNSLKKAIEMAGVQVISSLEMDLNMPDMVFVCNSGLVHDNKVYLSKFAHKERTGEEAHYVSWFQKNGFTIVSGDQPLIFEGGGDACFSTPETLWAGYGFRSDKAVYEDISAKLGHFEKILCELVDQKFYHLDTCFCPVDETTALWYPEAFSDKSQNEMAEKMPNLIAIDEREAQALVCNSINIRDYVISPVGMRKETEKELNKRGFKVVQVIMSEFMKAGGACQCLVMKLT